MFNLLISKKEKQKVLSHIYGLIEIAKADGDLDLSEFMLLLVIARKSGISEKEVHKMVNQSGVFIDNSFPIEKKECFVRIYDMVRMMLADRKIHKNEEEVCLSYLLKYGFSPSQIRLALDFMIKSVQTGHLPEQVFEQFSLRFS